ncbi:MAG: hypothetical protein PF505_04220 [Vallitaleaceae bacterium]|jgi:hypothetical protein|nr:hypothetical protein [Vallitaleaceae bacterium]
MVWWQILIIVVLVVVVVLVGLYFLSKRLQGKVDSQQSMIDQNKMTTTILVIDKKKLKVKDSNLPKIVQDQVPFYLRMRKMPLVKAKIGPKITTLMCDDRVYKQLPIKKNVKVELAGMYIVAIKGAKLAVPVKKTRKTVKAELKAKKAKLAKNIKKKA